MALLELHIRGESRRALERSEDPLVRRRLLGERASAWLGAKLASMTGPVWIVGLTIVPLHAMSYLSGTSEGGVRECAGRMVPRPTSGYVGDSIRITIQFRPPTHRSVSRVTLSRVRCQGAGCQAEQGGPRHFVWTGTIFSEGEGESRPGWLPARFEAYDEDGQLLCSGETRVRGLGARPE